MKTIEMPCLVCGAPMDVPRARARESFLMCVECHETHCWPQAADDAMFYLGALAVPYRVVRVSAGGHTIWVQDTRQDRPNARRCFFDGTNQVWRFCGDSRAPITAGYLLCGIGPPQVCDGCGVPDTLQIVETAQHGQHQLCGDCARWVSTHRA